MSDYEPDYILNKYNEKITSVEYKLKQAIGHADEQSRLLRILNVYINSMINDLSKMNESDFNSNSQSFKDVSKLYNMFYKIINDVSSVVTGTDMSLSDSDFDDTLNKESRKDDTIQKFKLLIGGIDKTMRYLDTLNKPAEESTFFEEINIADEAKMSYKIMRKAQTNTLALYNQLSLQKKLCSDKYNQCKGKPEMEKIFRGWLNKQKAAVQRKINGQEIKNKNALQKFISLYESYLNKLGTNVNESFIEKIFY